ncbi:hypothetical protein NO932_02470 [Pelagibacterium sp. 26DY04]|uniref:hypothetical protein n=1 Tax=Pelagibacterium sp. 26DY04 TaxID=2967130 RepID=UPI0028160223|nr:hypothetical protein [Pelagibacterium sp. 26DY04]WMT87485.1 hypothetical protein NO932_02470 [Pelagibacterium sp. 26DY04]
MSEWFYAALEATAGDIDPRELESYVWMGMRMDRHTTRHGEITVSPCGHTGITVLAYWGDNRLNRHYKLSIVDNELVVTLTESMTNGSMGRGENCELHFSRSDKRAIAAFEAKVDFKNYLAGLRPAFAEHFARGAIEDWRRAEIEHARLDTELRKLNKDLVRLPAALRSIKPHFHGPYAKMERERYARIEEYYDTSLEEARVICRSADDARHAADLAKEEMLTALRMVENVAPHRALPVDLSNVGDGPELGYAPGL